MAEVERARETWRGRSAEIFRGCVIVKLRTIADADAQLAEIATGYDMSGTAVLSPELRLVSLDARLSDEQTTTALCDRLMGDVRVEWAEPEFVHRASRTAETTALSPVYPTDPDFALQWSLPRVGLPIAWMKSDGLAAGVSIAILDSGIPLDAEGTLTHPDLMNGSRVVLEEDYTSTSFDDQSGHGTNVAGVLGATANNGVGIVGVNWKSRLRIFKVAVNEIVRPSFVVRALDAIRTTMASGDNVVIVYSYGGVVESVAMRDAVAAIDSHNAVGDSQAILFAPSGNSKVEGGVVEYPAKYSVLFPHTVVCVGATDKDDQSASFSSSGPEMTLVAPGVDIYTTQVGGGYASVEGTSFACPLVAGIASLMWSDVPSLKSAEVIQILKENAISPHGDVPSPEYGFGRVTALWRDDYFAARLTLDVGDAGEGEGLTLSFNLIEP